MSWTKKHTEARDMFNCLRKLSGIERGSAHILILFGIKEGLLSKEEYYFLHEMSNAWNNEWLKHFR